VTVGGKKVDIHRLHINRDNADGLNCIDAKEFSIFAAEFSDRGDVMPLAAGEFDVGYSVTRRTFGSAAASRIFSNGTARDPSGFVCSGTITSSQPCVRSSSIQG
jgi:hypothetical protein